MRNGWVIGVCLAVAVPTVGVAQERPPNSSATQSNTRSAFLLAVQRAEAARADALDAAEREYARVANALEAAGAELTADGRRRLEAGLLAKARQARSTATASVAAEWARRIDDAVRDYEAAGLVWNTMKRTVAALRMELEIFEAVVDAADRAAADAAAVADATRRDAADNDRDSAALEARVTEARRRYDTAQRGLAAAENERPELMDVPGAFSPDALLHTFESVAATARGDYAASDLADEAAEGAHRDRMNAILEAQSANDAAWARHDGMITKARAERDHALPSTARQPPPIAPPSTALTEARRLTVPPLPRRQLPWPHVGRPSWKQPRSAACTVWWS